MIILYIFFCAVTFFFIKRKDPNFHKSLSPSLLLLVMMFIYTIFGSLFILENSVQKNLYYKFWFIQILALVGVLISLFLNKFHRAAEIKRAIPTYKIKFYFLIIALFHLLFYLNKYGGITSILSSGYRLVFESEDLNLVNFSILGFLASFSILFKMHKLIFGTSILFFLVALLLGTRGIAIAILSIPILSYYLDNIRFSYSKLIFLLPLLIFFLIVAYIRNIGFSNFKVLFTLDSDFYYSLFIKNSEFITSGLVFYTGQVNPNWYDKNIMEYLLGIISAIIPKSIWSSRPDSISNLFSLKFAPPGEGIGFSLAYESFVILGYIGPVIYFYFVQKVLQSFYCSQKFYINALILFSPLLIMWVNRIDLQTILKVSLVYILYCYIWKLFIKIII